MKKAFGPLIGIAIVGGAAFLFGGAMLSPSKEQVEQRTPVLTGAYEVRLIECAVLGDSELPDGIAAPTVGESHVFMLVELLYPGVQRAAPFKEHVLSHVNGVRGPPLEPVHGESLPEEEGVVVSLVYRIDEDFEYARLESGGKTLVDRLKAGG